MTRLRFVCSYPKSGNTWVRMLVGHYLFGGHKNLLSRTRFVDNGRTWYQNVSPVPVAELPAGQQVQIRPAAMLQLARIAEPTLVKSHHAAITVEGVSLFSPLWTERVVVVVRDPRDILPSLADHMGIEMDEAADLMANAEATIQDDGGVAHLLTSWSQHVETWLGVESVPVHVLRYEDLHDDTAGELREVLAFLGVDFADPERIEEAVEACAFDRLQQKEAEIGFQEASPNQDRFFRKGEAGGWRDEVEPELAARIERDHGEMMDELGYEREAVTVG